MCSATLNSSGVLQLYPTVSLAQHITTILILPSFKHITYIYLTMKLIVAYRARYAINPFKKNEGNAFLAARTHNRRRWSHVFPKVWTSSSSSSHVDADRSDSSTSISTGGANNNNNGNKSSRGNNKKEQDKESQGAIAATTAAGSSVGAGGSAFSGLNWKSLCQPAILPITTDFVPAGALCISCYLFFCFLRILAFTTHPLTLTPPLYFFLLFLFFSNNILSPSLPQKSPRSDQYVQHPDQLHPNPGPARMPIPLS